MFEHTKPDHSPEAHSEESFRLLSELHNSPNLTQRQLSQSLNISLGKTNYLIQQLITKGILKMKNFSNNPGKLGKVKYILTGKGLEQKIKLTYHFLKRKEAEYNFIKNEWNTLVNQKQVEKIEGRK